MECAGATATATTTVAAGVVTTPNFVPYKKKEKSSSAFRLLSFKTYTILFLAS